MQSTQSVMATHQARECSRPDPTLRNKPNATSTCCFNLLYFTNLHQNVRNFAWTSAGCVRCMKVRDLSSGRDPNLEDPGKRKVTGGTTVPTTGCSTCWRAVHKPMRLFCARRLPFPCTSAAHSAVANVVDLRRRTLFM